MKRLPAYFAILGLLVGAAACGDEVDDDDAPVDVGGDGDGDDAGGDGDIDVLPPEIDTFSLSGSVVDFATGLPVEGQATLVTDGITPPPAVVVQGANFEVTEIPPSSVFHLLVGVPPTYHNTYAAAFELNTSDIEQAEVRVVSEDYLASLFAAFEVPLAPGGVLIAQLLDDAGAPLVGVGAEAFEINNAVEFTGPFFLGADLQPDPQLEATSDSGYVVFFDVPAGLVAVNAAPESGYTLTMAQSPTAATTITLASVAAVVGEEVGRPQNVSFKDDVLPIFELRGCTACHSGNEIGKDLGGLELDGKGNKLYKEVVEELSKTYGVPRIDLQNPANSLMLTQPSPEDPRDAHPNITFLGPTDPDYVTILVWIEEGALDN